jgi:hypothetical protein
MKKTTIIVIVVVLTLLAGAFYIFTSTTPDTTKEEVVLEQTLATTKEYFSLRLETDDVLVNAKKYPDYESWNTEMTKIIDRWEELGTRSQELETSAFEVAQVPIASFTLVQTANAYTAKEINGIYDKAPKFQGIATLAKHLGVDAKRAQMILDQTQAETNSEVFIEEGDAFETLENTAIVVKDGCKVVGFVGGMALTGGAAGLATAGTLAQASVVIVGADLALEVTEDGAQVALGDRNKISSFVGDVRTVTEPIATVLTITNIPSNLGSTYGRFDSVMIGLEQFRDTTQEGKVIGVDLKKFEYHKPFQRIRKAKWPGDITVAEMEKAEVEAWLQSLNKKQEPMTQAEVKEFLSKPTKEVIQEQEVVKEEVKKDTENEDTESVPETTGTKKTMITEEEFDDLYYRDKFENVTLVKKFFGEPDKVNTYEDGYYNYVYNDRLKSTSGVIQTIIFRFHDSNTEGVSFSIKPY